MEREELMKLQILKFVALMALMALMAGEFSCTKEKDWPQDEFQPINSGKKSSYITIDSNIISFAVPYLVHTLANEHPSQPGYGSPEGLSPHIWTIGLFMAKGTDVTKLSPIITLATGATITLISTSNDQVPAKQVDYTGIADVGEHNFRHQVDFTVIAPDGSTVTYKFLASADW